MSRMRGRSVDSLSDYRCTTNKNWYIITRSKKLVGCLLYYVPDYRSPQIELQV